MKSVKEIDRTPIEYIGTPKPVDSGDELKIYAVKNRQWFDITDMFDGGGVQSVTGVGVNNADPANPVVELYSTGTWTPTIQGQGSNPSVTYVSQTGRYSIIGGRFFFDINIEWSAVSGGSGDLRIPLPSNVSYPYSSNLPAFNIGLCQGISMTMSASSIYAVGSGVNFVEFIELTPGSAPSVSANNTVVVAQLIGAGKITVSGHCLIILS